MIDGMRVNPGGEDGGSGIDPWLAHATAVFPYFTKNSGQWLWDWIGFDHKSNQPKVNAIYTSENRMAYDNFIYGLYRLSQYNEFFNGNYQTYRPIDQSGYIANYNKKVWRGIIKEDKTQMLVAALNPYAKPDEVTTYQITCPPNVIKCKEGVALGEVKTTGQNTWLGVCNLDTGGCKGDEGKV